MRSLGPQHTASTDIVSCKPLITIHAMLPRMRERGGGCIINIASRSGTVDVPMTLGYVTSKAALIRATHTLQREMELDNLDPAIHIYALHPGGVLTSMGSCTQSPFLVPKLPSPISNVLTRIVIAGASKDVLDKYGDVHDEKFFIDLFKDPPALCGQTCAFLATGRGKELRGLYLGMSLSFFSIISVLAQRKVDCRQDVTKLLEQGRENLLKEKRNTLTVNFLNGYANEP